MTRTKLIQTTANGRQYAVELVGSEVRSVRVSVQPESAQAAYWRRVWSTGQCREMPAAVARVVQQALGA